jgi:prophage regulatory protein
MKLANEERFLRLPEVRNRVPYSRATIYRLISQGQFPEPFKLGPRAVAWRASDVDNWIADRLRDGGRGAQAAA